MGHQVGRADFAKALTELGHDPSEYTGKRLTLSNMCNLYELGQEMVIEAIDKDLVQAHYDYRNDTIWVDALDAAHFYYCLKSKAALYG